MALTVDPVKLAMEKRRTVRQLHQNVRDEQLRGAARKELLVCLGLWDEEQEEDDNKEPYPVPPTPDRAN